jgi:hypothetical protein
VTRKISLPMVDEILAKAGANPTLERARKRLGGRGRTDALAGTVVTLDEATDGVVLFADDVEVDVLVDDTTVKRTARRHVSPAREVRGPLASLAGDVLVFARLEEGQRVLLSTEQGMIEGLLFEKCRYGALVAKDDGAVLAVGFRKLWPVALGDA